MHTCIEFQTSPSGRSGTCRCQCNRDVQSAKAHGLLRCWNKVVCRYQKHRTATHYK